MRVEPGFPNHPKIGLLEDRVGGEACKFVLRLWGHCQEGQRGGTWKKATPKYVEVVCRWPGEAGKLFEALTDPFINFIEKKGDSLVIHDWDRMNSRAVTAWDNGSSGKRTQKRIGLLKVGTQRQPNSNLAPAYGGMNGRDERRDGSGGAEPLQGPFSEIQVPSREEFLAACRMKGIPDWRAEQEFNWRSERPAERWPSSNWQAAVTTLFSRWRDQEGAPMEFGEKNAAKKPREMWQIEEDLKTVTVALDTHPRASWPANRPVPPEVQSEYDGLKALLAALKSEKAGNNGG